MKRTVLCISSLMVAAMAYSATYAPWLDGNWSAEGIGGTWADNGSGSFWWSTNGLPGAADTVVLNGAKTINLDADATIASLIAADGVFNANVAGKTLTVNSTATFSSTANVTEGTVHTKGNVTVNPTGVVNINGGTFGRTDNSGAGVSAVYTGGGLIQLQSGAFSVLNGGVTNLVNVNGVNIEVSGGSLDFDGQVWLGQTVATEFKVTGDASDISFLTLNQAAHNPNATFSFILNNTGVSSVDVDGWMYLDSASVYVDGSSYSQTVGEFITLFDSASINGELDDANVTVDGFGVKGTDWELVHDYDNTRVGISVIPEPATLGMVAFSGLLVLVVRRFKM